MRLPLDPLYEINAKTGRSISMLDNLGKGSFLAHLPVASSKATEKTRPSPSVPAFTMVGLKWDWIARQCWEELPTG